MTKSPIWTALDAGCDRLSLATEHMINARIGVIDRDLTGGQTMLQDLVFGSGEGQRPRRVESKRFEVAGDQFYRGITAVADVGN
jgi:hypothetical protein